MKIATIIGTRPNFIKCAPVSKVLRKGFDEILIHTGQHYDFEMNKIFFEELGIPEPDYHLNIKSQKHGYQTGIMLYKIEELLLKIKPNIVLVYGDCNTTLAGALAAVKQNILLAHIEAGLRSFDKSMPEEINRILTDHCSNLLFCPTKTSILNLKNEGLKYGIYLTGDVMNDSLKNNLKISEKSKILERLGLTPKNYFLLTIHRQGNTDSITFLSNIIKALSYKEDIKIIFPIHPRTEKIIKNYNLKKKIGKNIQIIKPVGYFDFLWLQKNAKKILTDSGGVQKEAYILKIPCITLRDNTEWIETVKDGWNVLVGNNIDTIINAIEEFKPIQKHNNIFGNGKAANNIFKTLQKYESIV